MVRVKICCISSEEEAKLAIKHGASAVGLVSEMPSGPGVVSEKMISKIAGIIPPGVSSFLLTSKVTSDEIIKQHKKCGTNVIQLVDWVEKVTRIRLKAKLPGIKIVQAIHVIDEESVKQAINASETVDALLLDSGNPNLPVKELGGTGRTHNWELSKSIVEQVNVPVFLAGGLNSENIKEAIEFVKPFGVDLCSGVRTNNKLDESKLAEFFKAIKELE
ncbi:MAG: phosphoribosylanthranilate isomerase [Ignavibacteria bacterium]|jgi:phosphoribosylanthranilate isomerase